MDEGEVAESLLVQIWKRQLVAVEKLVTASGERLKVIYPGKENKDSGPDFVGAIIATANGGLLRGDVELHMKAGDWKNHGHHRDPRYNDVILQVVWDREAGAALQSGKVVPTLVLRYCLSGSLDEVRHQVNLPMVPNEPCHNAVQRLGGSELVRLLDEAGDERFRMKAGYFKARLENEPPSEVLYQGIMGALGYTKNKAPFEELARRLSLADLEGICRGKPYQEQVQVLKVQLLGKAGLLPEGENLQLRQIRHCVIGGEMMSPSCWQRFRVRPENHPVRRLIGAAHLLARFMEVGGLLDGVVHLFSESFSDADRLEVGFMVRATETCFDNERTLVGQGRAREIVINVVLPFTFAWAESSSQAKLSEQVLDRYRSYPKAGENEITRGLTRLLLDSPTFSLVKLARRQQGLIHLAKNFCHQRWCTDCPLGKRLPAVKFAS